MKIKVREYSTGEITAHALKELDLRGVECWRSNNIAVKGRKFIGRKGVSDIMGFVRRTGIIVACEVKKTGDTIKEDQRDFLTQITNAGGIALIATQRSSEVLIQKFSTVKDEVESLEDVLKSIGG